MYQSVDIKESNFYHRNVLSTLLTFKIQPERSINSLNIDSSVNPTRDAQSSTLFHIIPLSINVNIDILNRLFIINKIIVILTRRLLPWQSTC